MPRKKITPVTEEEREIHEEPIASFPTISAPRNYSLYYVLLLIVFAFLLGSLSTKLQDKTAQATAAAQIANQPTQPAQQPQGPAAHVDVDKGHFPALGQDSAKVTIIEFADERCPFCKQWADNTFPQLKSDYIDTGKVKFYFRNYDFLGPASVIAGNAVECANEQGKFWDLHDYFYKNQPDESDTSMFTTDKLSGIAGDLGMDATQFSSCLSSNKDNTAVTKDLSDGQKAGVSGTPTFFINGTSLVGAQPYAALKTIIDQELAK
ncbi:MAG TPA: DsbA family protein [Candidatus Saccharimonadales bacterium]|nr:DsbA family protein [Candidatus Saccharimonadales bacterium]